MLRATLVCILAASCAPPSEVRDDEVIVFFPGVARRAQPKDAGPSGVSGVPEVRGDAGESGDRGEAPGWIVEIHGWIHEPEEDSILRAGLLEGLRKALGLEKGAGDAALFRERARWFLVDNERGKEIPILLGGTRMALGPSLPNGHFKGTIRLGEEEFSALLRERRRGTGPIPFRAITREGDERIFAGEIHVVDGPGISVVSDIDDTVKISETSNRRALLENTFLREYRAVPGMAELYGDLHRAGAAFHYVSASPWQLYGPLSEFLAASGFPGGTFRLKDFRPKDSTFFNLFEDPLEYKLSAIEPLIATFPDRRFILIGDSTEKDPEVYGEIARRHPEMIERILIREVDGSPMDADRIRRAFDGVPSATWTVFSDPSEVRTRKERSL